VKEYVAKFLFLHHVQSVNKFLVILHD